MSIYRRQLKFNSCAVYLSLILLLILPSPIFSQPVQSFSDVVPVTLSLEPVLRVNVLNGGNIEFVFSNLSKYKSGIGNNSFYDTDITVASSQNWSLDLGAEDANFIGSENPANTSFTLNNIGFNIDWTGIPLARCCGVGVAVNQNGNAVAVGGGNINGLSQFETILPVIISGTGNAGTPVQNAFTINWECGTTVGLGSTVMNPLSVLGNNYVRDRYVTNIFIDIDPVP